MSDHMPECPLLEPCSADTPNHGFCSRQNTICIHCERECICPELRACEQRVARTREGNGELWLDGYGTGWQDGHTFALNAAREAVEAIPAPYKIRGDFATYGSYAEGKADFKDAALSAINALREDRQTPPPLPPSVGVPERRWT